MNITNLLNKLGIESEALIKLISILLTLLIAGAIAWIVYIIIKKWLPKLIGRITRKSKYKWDDYLLDQKFFNRLGGMLMPIVLKIGLSGLDWEKMGLINDLLSVWIVIAGVMLISSFLGGITRVYENLSTAKDRPVRVFVQVVMIFVWCAALLSVVSIFTEQNITTLLAGLTAFAAILMLVFQDSILGFVAGIQLSANNMVRVGDWIEMPSRGVDGDVKEINLTTVKVQNWDKTITTVPTHKLVSESFTNWRGMEESGGRRIKRSVNIDVTSIHYLDEAELEVLCYSQLLSSYMTDKLTELKKYNTNRASHLDERRLTNVGTFREYLEMWISNNPSIHQGMTHMVRQLQPGPTGLPIEIYCFSANQAWVAYEKIQADIFDHIYAVLPLFNLRAFQYSGTVVEKK